MSAVETLRSIETGLQEFRDLAESTGSDTLSYFIDLAILEAKDLLNDARPVERNLNVIDLPSVFPLTLGARRKSERFA